VRESIYTKQILDTVEHWDGSMLGPSGVNRRLEGVSVFKASWFERYFATAHPIMPGIWWGPAAVYCIYWSLSTGHVGRAVALVAVVMGFLAWTLLEYGLHRFVFHHVPEMTFDSKFTQFMVHGYHHEFPNDRKRLVAPLLLSVPIGALIAGLYYMLLGGSLWPSAYAGTLFGYLTYDWTHYYTHHFRPTTRIGKFLRRYHMEHHYKDSQSHFGISSPLWDWVFRTAGNTAGDQGSATGGAGGAPQAVGGSR
jgi:sterol desaturase/sphingolipid hydroxylase (fatty acid hydroxylase superfamily)